MTCTELPELVFALDHSVTRSLGNRLHHAAIFFDDTLLFLAKDGLDRRVEAVAPDASTPDRVDDEIVGLPDLPNAPETC